jgi:glycosyltransferase involved in cell wall biosynthesis
MKIVHVISRLDPFCGGPPQVVMRLAAAQAMLGHDVQLVAYGQPDKHSEAQTRRQFARIPYLQAVTMHTLPAINRFERWAARKAGALLPQVLHGADWLHLHGVWERLLHKAAAEALRLKIPYCLRPSGMLNPWSLQQKRWKKKLALGLGIRRVIERAQFIHCLNAEEAALIAPLKLSPPPLVFPNGVFLEEFAQLPPAGSFASRQKSLNGRRFVLFLGRLAHVKGLDVLAEAWIRCAAQVPGVDLVVAGPDEGVQVDFDATIARAGLSDRVHVVGPMYGEEKFAALVDAACFCLPSRQEGFSVAVLEALACGVPAVISEACRFPEAAAAGAAEVVPLEPGLLAEALIRVLSDPLRAAAMGRAGQDLIRSQYTWSSIAGRLIDSYRAFAPQPGPAVQPLPS